jgi:hypothetical protein
MGAHRAAGQACGVAEWARDELGWAGGRLEAGAIHLASWSAVPAVVGGKAGGKLGVVLALSRQGLA